MKAAEDDEFRARLVADPRAALEEETGLRLPDDYRLHVHEESATDAHMGAVAQAGAQPGATGAHRRRGSQRGTPLVTHTSVTDAYAATPPSP